MPLFLITKDKEYVKITLKLFINKALYNRITKNYTSDNKEKFYNALTSSEEKQLNNLVIKEESIKARNKRVLQDFSVKAITKKEDVT